MAVAELPVIVQLEGRTHGVIGYGKLIDNSLCRLNGIAQEIIKTIPVYTLSGNGTVKTPQTSADKGIFPDINNSCFVGDNPAETVDHALQSRIFRTAVGYYCIRLWGFR